jgi:hypothetical protein
VGAIKQGVCHTMALTITLKSILHAKEELWKLKYFTMQKYNLQKFRNQNLSRYL